MASLFNWSGNPAVTLPSSFTSSNLPVGPQIIMPKEKEVELLQASWAFENICSWHNRRPKV
jgi:Asp-tRNA(Asn)/Glu-tRNA(Gln) amidotransferase A subunit family amidase